MEKKGKICLKALENYKRLKTCQARIWWGTEDSGGEGSIWAFSMGTYAVSGGKHLRTQFMLLTTQKLESQGLE